MLQRRDFITGCAASAAALAAPGGVFAAAKDTLGGHPSLQGATSLVAGRAKAVFSAALGQRFRCIDAAGLTRTLVLAEVVDGPDAPGIEQFMVVFADNSEGILARMASDSYVLQNKDAGTFLFHLESAGVEENRYVVHFSLLT